MREASIADAKKERLKKAQRRKADKKFGSGIKGGFFNKKKKKKKATQQKAAGAAAASCSKKSTTTVDDVVDIPSLSADSSSSSSPNYMPEVQAAMSGDMPGFLNQTKDQWANEGLMQRVKDNPKLLQAMADPRFGPMMQLMQTDPNRVIEMAKTNSELADFLKLFGSVVGGHFEELGTKQKKEEEEKEAKRRAEQAKRDAAAAAHAAKVEAAKNDPAVQSVLGNAQLRGLLEDPEVKEALRRCQEEPGALQRYMQNPKMRAAFMMMQQAGLVQIHPGM